MATFDALIDKSDRCAKLAEELGLEEDASPYRKGNRLYKELKDDFVRIGKSRLKRCLDKLFKQSDDDYSAALGIMFRIAACSAANEAERQRLRKLCPMIGAAFEEMVAL